MAPTTTTTNAIGTGPMRVASHDVKSRSMTPPGVSRSVSEIPLRMLSVASVAMIDGIFSPTINPAFTNPSAIPQRKIAPTPSRICEKEESEPIRYDAITTPSVTIAPTERSRYPTRSAWVWPMATIARGTARRRMVVTFDRLMKPGKRDVVYAATAPISRSWSTTGIHRRNRTIFRHLFLSRASRRTLRIARLAESRRALTSCLDGTMLWAWRRRTANARLWTGRDHGRWPRRCGARRAPRRGSPR